MESLILFMVFIGLMTFIYFKIPTTKVVKLPILTLVYLFSLILSTGTFFQEVIIGTPYLQIFFILYQTVFIVMTCLEYFEFKRKEGY